MTWSEVLQAFATLRIWARKGDRAPHKPLLILYALGRWAAGNREQIPFAEVDERLTALLDEFGRPRETQSPEQPFWRLRRDNVWELCGEWNLSAPAAVAPPTPNQLRTAGVSGTFSQPVREALLADSARVMEIARLLLDQHFPESIHPDILTAVGLDPLDRSRVAPVVPKARRRDPEFRRQVLEVYGERCAVCGVCVRLNRVPIGLEAAHIHWFQYGGPDEVRNGLALCSLHHKAFDLGAFTVSPERVILVSHLVTGEGDSEVLLRHHERDILRPSLGEATPDKEFLSWHRREVFKGSPRS